MLEDDDDEDRWVPVSYWLPGPLLGAGDAGPAERREAEEGSGAAVQPAAHRVPADALRDAHGRHPLQALHAAQSLGKAPNDQPPLLQLPFSSRCDCSARPLCCDWSNALHMCLLMHPHREVINVTGSLEAGLLY